MKRRTADLLRAVVQLVERDLHELEDSVAQIDHRSGGQSEALTRHAELIARLDARVANAEAILADWRYGAKHER